MGRVLFLAGNIVKFEVTSIRLYDTLSELSKSLEKPMLIAFVDLLIYFKSGAKSKVYRKFKKIGVDIRILPRMPFIGSIFTIFTVIRKNIDIIHTVGHTAAVTGSVVKLLTRVKLIFDIRGVAPEEKVAAEIWNRSGIKYRIAKILEKKCIEISDCNIVVSNVFKKYVENSFKVSNVKVFPCCVSHRFCVDSKKREVMRNRFHLQDRFVIIYSGSFARWTLMSEMVDIFRILKKKVSTAHFLILTQADKMETSNLMINHRLLKGEFTIINLSHEEVPAYLLMGDIGLLLREKSIINRVACPVKFAEYLACGVPVLSTDGIGDVSDLIRKHRIGRIINLRSNNSKIEGVDSILDLVLNDKENLQERCRNVARDYFSLERYIEKYIHIYDSLA